MVTLIKNETSNKINKNNDIPKSELINSLVFILWHYFECFFLSRLMGIPI